MRNAGGETGVLQKIQKIPQPSQPARVQSDAMKTLPILLLTLVLTAAGALADSKRTAVHVLTDPSLYQDKEVTLDVAFVRPVHFVSPFPELAFFHALTVDRTDDKPAGSLLVAIPSANATSFARKYGTDFDGRGEKDTLRGTLVAAGPGPRGKIWVVDTSGQLLKLIDERKKNLPEDADSGQIQGDGGGMGMGKPRGPMNRPPR